MQSCAALRAARVTEIPSACTMLQERAECSLMSILLDACHSSLLPQLKPQQSGNSLLIICKFNSTCRDGVKEEPVKPREVSVYLKGKISVSGRRQQNAYTNSSSSKGAGHYHSSNIPWLLAALPAARAESVVPSLCLLPFLIPVSAFFKQAPHTALVLLIVLVFPGAALNAIMLINIAAAPQGMHLAQLHHFWRLISKHTITCH